jgi:hypothetical protein
VIGQAEGKSVQHNTYKSPIISPVSKDFDALYGETVYLTFIIDGEEPNPVATPD